MATECGAEALAPQVCGSCSQARTTRSPQEPHLPREECTRRRGCGASYDAARGATGALGRWETLARAETPVGPTEAAPHTPAVPLLAHSEALRRLHPGRGVCTHSHGNTVLKVRSSK